MTTQNFVPNRGKYIVSRDDAESVSKGGIVLPDQAKEKPTKGTVLAVGEGRYENGVQTTPAYHQDDRVLFSPYCGTEIEKNLIVVDETDILAKLC